MLRNRETVGPVLDRMNELPRPSWPPRWTWVVLGAGVTMLLQESRAPPMPEAYRRAAEELPCRVEPWQMSARELRRLPGIGQKRAIELVRTREEHRGGALAWQDVYGIGPATERKVLAWLRRHGVEAESFVPAGE